MSSTIMAQRKHGVCQGCLYRSIGEYSTSSSSYYSSSSSGSSSGSGKVVYEYCVLVGVLFRCYESFSAFEKGQPPVASFCIVGSSMAMGRSSSSRYNNSSAHTTNTSIGDASFKLVTNQGTHLKCTAPTTTCRDIWLRALAAGLTESLSAPPERQRPILKRVKPRYQDAKTQKFCASCGKVERWEFPLVMQSRPLAQYGLEDRRDLCYKCETSQGVLDHCHYVEDLYAAAWQERKTLLQVRKLVVKKLQGDQDYEPSDTEPTNLSLQPLSHHLLQSSLRSPQLVADCRNSPILEDLGLQFQQGLIGVLEFVEMLEHAVGIKDKQMGLLKTQAFRVAGDMGTALKLLNDCQKTNDIELFHSILEFFLDLLDEGELKTLAFFWPQLCMIHLQLLPPTDAASLMQVELLEDFLLTVATQHSVHLAIALIWSHTADLEDSRTLPYCLKRKYAVLRFLCELESLLFDFDSGWGGGSVTVGQFLSPSVHQVACLKTSMEHIQNYRLSQQHEYLSRSRRLTKLRKTRDGAASAVEIEHENPEQMAQEALRIAANADYLSSHLVFTKRLCDIAEKLRFLDVEKRPAVLRKELAKLNTSGAMGGDPLNSVKDSHSRVIRIPMGEGHVFRSKERTPVLLLAEIIDEGAERDSGPTTAFPTRLPTEESFDGGDINDDGKLPTVLEDEKKETKEEGETTEQLAENAVEDEDEKKSNNDEGTTNSTTTATTPPPEDESTIVESAVPSNGEEETSGATATPTENGNDEKSDGPEQAKENGAAVEGEATTDHPPSGASEDSDDFHSAQGSISEEPLKPGSEDGDRKVVLSGSLEGLDADDANRSSRHALRRFDSPKGEPRVVTPSTNKETVESLVTEVVAKQLHMPTLMDAPSRKAAASDHTKTEADKDVGKEVPIVGPAAKTSKVSALVGKTSGTETNNPLSKTGDTRREVLTAIMQTGMEGGHTIAAGAATAAQRHLQDLERRRAVELLLRGEDVNAPPPPAGTPRADRHELLALGIRSASTDDLEGELPGLSEDDEAMEAIRLLLIQYQVAQGGLSLNDAAAVLAPKQSLRDLKKKKSVEGTMMHFGKEFPEIEAGDIDQRLVGCGVLPPAVLQALTLWKANMITNGELLELVKKDLEFVKNSSEMELSVNKLNEDSAFWGRFAFGERWAEKRSRIAASSPEATQPGWDLIGIIVKSNDDLRQEAFVMQLIELCKEAFQEAGLELWLLPYKILPTGRTTGIIEMVRNAMSFDALKKRPGYGKGGLRDHLRRMTQFAADPGEAYKTAQHNFVRSLSAYSLLSFLFLFKDRHNGNLLLDTAGHVIHIDFGFVFGTAPGGSFSLEMSTPFKLTEEMIEVMDGLRSSHFSEFVTLFCCGFLALQAHSETFLTLIEITCKGSTFDCFEGKNSADVLEQMKGRLRPELDKAGTIAFCLDIIKEATQSYGTAQYDYFQYLSQGIAT